MAPAREIGGDFHFPVRSRSKRRLNSAHRLPQDADTVLLASGRDALHHIIRSLNLAEGERVLLPSYLCDDVMAPFRSHGLTVEFYRVDRNLKIDKQDLMAKLTEETKVLLYINYFGFPFDLPPEVSGQLNSGTVIVEDASHSFLSRLEQQNIQPKVVFASYRKLLPIPDGASVTGIGANAQPWAGFSIRFWVSLSCRFAGALLKGIWIRRPFFPKAIFRRLFKWSEKLLDSYNKPVGMSFISKKLLNRIDLEEVISIRRRNYATLSKGLQNSGNPRPLYSSLPEYVCPVGFPVLSDDRDSLAQHLINHDVFPPIHWELPKSVNRDEYGEVWTLSDQILTIPIDQRYDQQDMARILDVINSFKPMEQAWFSGR